MPRGQDAPAESAPPASGEVLNLEELQHYDDESIGTQVGIGIELKKIQSMTSTGPLEIAAVIEDGPAARAGIQAGDGTNTLIGLTPDIEVLPPTDWQSEGDVQLHAATEYLNATTNIGT